MTNPDDDVRLARERRSLAAHKIAMEGDPDRALAELGDRKDPVSFRTRLAILIDCQRTEEAARLASSADVEREWADKALFALSYAGDLERSEAVFRYIKKDADRGFRTRCSLAYARGLLGFVVHESGAFSVSGELAPVARERLNRLLSLVDPIISVVKANEGIETEVQEEAVILALSALHRLGDQSDRALLARHLANRQPVPLALARLVLSGVAPTLPDLPSRLRAEYPNSFEGKLLAVQVEGNILQEWRQAFDQGCGLVPEVSERVDRLALWSTLHDLAQHIDEDAIRVVDALQPVLAKDDSLLAAFTTVERHLRQGEHESAKHSLESMRDESDPRWMQLWAHSLLEAGQAEEALSWLAKAVAISPHPELLRRTAALALRTGDLSRAEGMLWRLLAVSSHEATARETLAQVLYRGNKFAEAAGQFETLYREQEGRIDYGLAWANSLARAGEIASAIAVYDTLCKVPDAPVDSFIGVALLRRSLGQLEAAFSTLYESRDRFWDVPDYLAVVIDLGYASGHEELAADAMKHLLELQERGDSPEILKRASLDDVKQMFHERAEYQLHLYDKHLEGQLPWLAVDRALGKATHVAWAYRTQPLPWLLEDRREHAEHVVYATNGLHVSQKSDGKRRLEPLACPPRGVSVVADWSALITLSELDLLPVAADYFDKLLIPADYYTRSVLDASRLSIHQHSRRTTVEAVRQYLDQGRMHVIESEDTPPHDIVAVAEYDTEPFAGKPRVGFRTLVDILDREGRLPGVRADALRNLIKVSTPEESRCDLGQSLLLPSTELLTLNQLGILALVVEAFQVHITAGVRNEVVSDDREIRLLATTRRAHDGLWEFVRNAAKCTQVPSSGKRYQEYQRNVPADEVALASACLAEETGKALFADDRVGQTLVANSRPLSSDAAFGTDRFLEGAFRAGLIDLERFVATYLTLMRWRYRFLVPPLEVLIQCARDHRHNPPGEALRSIARYAHDSTCDPGLFRGEEATDIPTSIARELHQEWLTTIAGFVVAVWSDADFGDESATALAEWAASELVPTFLGRTAWESRSVPQLTARATIAQAMVRAVAIEDQGRARAALTSLAKALGLHRKDYERIVLDIVDAV